MSGAAAAEAEKPFAHLDGAAEALLGLSDPDRIAEIEKERWIGYGRAREVLDRLEELLNRPKTHRMPNLLLVGETNNGKTSIINRFSARHPADNSPDADGISVPVLVLQAPPVPDENRLYSAILESVFSPYRPLDNVSKKQFQVLSVLGRIGVRMLVIDEIHNILAGAVTKQRQVLNALKYLGNELKIPIAGVGIGDAARAIQSDPQLSNRFQPAILPRWEMNAEYMRLLASFERMIPLKKPSRLTETALAAKLLSMSEGLIGELSTLLKKAAVRAVRTGTEKIDAKALDSVGWVPPSDRRKRAARMA